MILGDVGVGKSSLITNYVHNTFVENNESTVLDIYRGRKTASKQEIEIELHDSPGDDHLSQRLTYDFKSADAFIICIAANNRHSLQNIEKWTNMIDTLSSKAPLFLVLTKSDLKGAVTLEQLRDIRNRDSRFQGAYKTSAKEWMDFNVHKAFNKVLQSTLSIKYNI